MKISKNSKFPKFGNFVGIEKLGTHTLSISSSVLLS